MPFRNGIEIQNGSQYVHRDEFMLDNKAALHSAADLTKSMSLKKKIMSSRSQQGPLLELHDITLHSSVLIRNLTLESL